MNALPSSAPAATPHAIVATIDKPTLATIPLIELQALEKVARTVYDVTAAFACQNSFSSPEGYGANRGGEALADLLDMLGLFSDAVEDARAEADTEHPTKVCPVDGTRFSTHGDQTYCSRECFEESKRDGVAA